MFERFKQRSYELERIDKGEYTPGEYKRWHKEMWYIHRFFGEMRALKNSLLKTLRNDGINAARILDVGAGAGELLSQIRKWTPHGNHRLVGVEISDVAVKEILAAGHDSVRADALCLPFADGSFDYVFCSLFLHHLGDEAAVELLREMKRVASKRIFVIDLNRHPLAYYSYKFFGALVLQRFTLEDGALSILRSFTAEEMVEAAEKAGLEDIDVTRSKLNRLIVSGI